MARERKENNDEKPPDNFAMLFVALNLILLSFFILLSALSQRDEERSRKAIGSLLGAFGILEGGQNVSSTGKDPSHSMPISAGDQQTQMKKSLEKKLKTKLAGPGQPEASVILTADGIKVVFTDRLTFRVGGVELNPKIFPLLDSITSTLRQANRGIVVRGWADASPHPHNLELSAVRAARVARYLIEADGLSAQLVTAEGWGVNSEAGEAGRFVELLLPTPSLIRPLEDI